MKIRLWDIVILFALLAAWALYFNRPVSGADFRNGQVIDGHTFRDGFWWNGSTPYTLSRTPVYRGYSNCVAYYRNSFKRAAVYNTPQKVVEKTYVPPTVAEKPAKGWRETFAEIKKAEIEFQQKQADAIRDHKEYMEAAREFGFTTNQTPSAYGYKLSQFQHKYNPYAQQGNTLYGYSLNTLAESYGQADVNVWMQQYSRGIQNAQISADKGLSGMLEAIQTEGTNRQKVAEILALKALVETLNVPETKTRTELEFQGTGQSHPDFQAQGFAQGAAMLGQAFARSCYACHSPNGVQGISGRNELFPQGVDLTQYQRFTPQQKNRVHESVDSGAMPKGDYPPLNPIERALLYADAKAALKD